MSDIIHRAGVSFDTDSKSSQPPGLHYSNRTNLLSLSEGKAGSLELVFGLGDLNVSNGSYGFRVLDAGLGYITNDKQLQLRAFTSAFNWQSSSFELAEPLNKTTHLRTTHNTRDVNIGFTWAPARNVNILGEVSVPVRLYDASIEGKGADHDLLLKNEQVSITPKPRYDFEVNFQLKERNEWFKSCKGDDHRKYDIGAFIRASYTPDTPLHYQADAAIKTPDGAPLPIKHVAGDEVISKFTITTGIAWTISSNAKPSR